MAASNQALDFNDLTSSLTSIQSYTHLHRNARMRLIPLDLKVLRLPPIDTTIMVIQNIQLRKLPRFPIQLYFQRIHMIQVNMRVSHRMDKGPSRKITHIGQHVRQKSVRRDIEGDPEPNIARALVELARQYPLLLLHPIRRFSTINPVRLTHSTLSSLAHSILPPLSPRKTDIKLRKHMTRRQGHLAQIRRIPRTQYDPPIIRRLPQLPHHLRQLIHTLFRIIRFRIHILGPKMPPLEPVHGSQIPLFTVRKTHGVEKLAGSVTVPDFDAGGGEGEGGGAAGDEPEEFGDYGA